MATSSQYLTGYEKAQKRYQDLVTGQGTFTDLVKKKLGETTNYNKDLLEQQNRLAEEQLSLPSQLRAEFASGPIRNPLTQESIIQGRQSNVGSSLGSVSDLLAARGQREQDILSGAATQYGTQLQGAGTAAENAWRLYQDRLAQEEAARSRAAAAQQENLAAQLLEYQKQQQLAQQQAEQEARSQVADKAYRFAQSKGLGARSGVSGYTEIGTPTTGIFQIDPLTGRVVSKPTIDKTQESVDSSPMGILGKWYNSLFNK